jgi:hypothetical protein
MEPSHGFNKKSHAVLDVLGPTVEFLVLPSECHVALEVRHAWKNESDEPAVAIIVTTPRLGRFFQEVGRPVAPDASPQAPSPADVQRFAEVAARYHDWLAIPEENAAVGINLSA